jgi:hypothetical protein
MIGINVEYGFGFETEVFDFQLEEYHKESAKSLDILTKNPRTLFAMCDQITNSRQSHSELLL